MYTFIILIALILLLYFWFIEKIFGNWVMTLEQVTKNYLFWQKLYPQLSKEELFNAVLDSRYPYSPKSLEQELFQKKQALKEQLKNNQQFDLHYLIYACLQIEANNLVKKGHDPYRVLNEIEQELIKQGH